MTNHPDEFILAMVKKYRAIARFTSPVRPTHFYRSLLEEYEAEAVRRGLVIDPQPDNVTI